MKDDNKELDDNLDAEIDALADDPNALRRLLRGKVAKEAAKALLNVCADPRAPAPAKAAAGSALLRAGGYFEKFDGADEEAAPMTVEALEQHIERLEALGRSLPPDVTPEPALKPAGKGPKRGKPAGGLFD
jgi:hypothetical protein